MDLNGRVPSKNLGNSLAFRLTSGALDGLQTGKDGHKYQLSLKPMGSISMFMLFRPVEECVHKHALTVLTSTGSSGAGKTAFDDIVSIRNNLSNGVSQNH